MFLLRIRYYPRTLDLAFSRRMITSAFLAGYSLRNRGDVITLNQQFLDEIRCLCLITMGFPP